MTGASTIFILQLLQSDAQIKRDVLRRSVLDLDVAYDDMDHATAVHRTADDTLRRYAARHLDTRTDEEVDRVRWEFPTEERDDENETD